MATKKKMLEAAAGNAGGDPLDITEVFSTYLYSGTGSAQTITNGIDLDGEGGLVWFKHRAGDGFGGSHWLIDTERGGTKYLKSESTAAQSGNQNYISAFNVNGFTIGTGDAEINYSSGNSTYASWTFRKAPKFFDVVTWTGDGTTGRTISHSLGCDIGFVSVKASSTTGNWICSHKDLTTNYCILLNSTAAEQGYVRVNNLTTTGFDVHDYSSQVGSTNASGVTYVAYLFAHNDGDGGFGPDGDQDIIKCGSYTGNSSNNHVINLGFEPEWIMIKRASGGIGSWLLFDVMRGLEVTNSGSGKAKVLYANLSDAADPDVDRLIVTPTGVSLTSTDSAINASGSTYIYMAIRRGPVAPPEAGTEVFSVNEGTPGFTVGFAADFNIHTTTSPGENYAISRLTGDTREMRTDSTNAEANQPLTKWFTNGSASTVLDLATEWYAGTSNVISWSWKRAPSFFDVVAYTGTGSPNIHAPTLSHSLGVPPEMVWVKKRSSTSNWAVVSQVGTGGVQAYLDLDNGNVGTLATTGPSNVWSDYFTATQVIGNGGGGAYDSAFPVTHLNATGTTYIAYLFASLDGISKVGNYTGNGSSQTINAGFTTGARYILIKRTDSTGDWYVWDSVRGIVAGNDPHLSLNTNAAEVTTDDSIDPDSSGFIVNQVSATNINVSSATYIYYAVA